MRIGTSLPELIDSLALLYADYPLGDDDEIPDFYVRVEPIPRWRRPFGPAAVAVIDGRASFDPFPRAQALPMLEWALNWCVFSRPNQYLLLHAAVVESGGAALILPGQPGAGKSTLAAALVARGWRLFSDEVAMILPGTREIWPLPRPIGLKDTSIAVIRQDWPAATIGPATPGTRKGTVAHVRPSPESLARADEPAPPQWMVFPRFEVGAVPTVTRISRADALLRVGDEAFNYSLMGLTGFRTLSTIIEGCECFDVRFGTLDDALACVAEITGVNMRAQIGAGRAQ
jgi:HprK-related kinase A